MNSCISEGLPRESDLADLLLLHSGGVFRVGPGLDAIVVPEPLAHDALDIIGGHPADPVGAVAALADGWVFFVPEESDDPNWPEPVRYLRGGSTIRLPPPPGAPEAHDHARWIRWPHCGRVFTAPLLLQFTLHALGKRILTS
ncbi:hypothetical protein ACRWOO_02640 [Streptomyces sp. NEAU-PBA10]|uniref:Uncharacterized protein n=1 Tax=Streptomyces tremellae TaxID=1124239 RepID=A0ABP7DZ94_9ACTN